MLRHSEVAEVPRGHSAEGGRTRSKSKSVRLQSSRSWRPCHLPLLGILRLLPDGLPYGGHNLILWNNAVGQNR